MRPPVKHFLFWTFYGIYFFLLNRLSNEEMTIATCLITIPYFALVYYSLSFILNQYHEKKNIWSLTSRILLFFLVSFLLVYYLTYENEFFSLLYGAYFVPNYSFSWGEFWQTYLIMHGHFTILALLTYHHKGKLNESNQKVKEMELRLQAEEERRVFEYAALSAQVPPHMLTNIFGLWEKELRVTQPEMANQMDKLNQIIHYCMQAHEVNGPRVILLTDELKIVNDFIDIQKIISKKDMHVDVSISGNIYQCTLPPTILFTLIENAIKHGNNSNMHLPLKLEVNAESQICQIKVSNFKSQSSKIRSHGIGLENLKGRLNMVYGNGYTMNIEEDDSYYRVNLIIQF